MKSINIYKIFHCFPEALSAFDLNKGIEESAVTAIDEDIPFEVETDALEVALASILNQAGCPVTFLSRTLQGPEVRLPSVEKEA